MINDFINTNRIGNTRIFVLFLDKIILYINRF